MAENNPTRKVENKQLKASEVYEIVSTTLQEHFHLDMQAHDYKAQDIWDVLIAASVERITIEMASQLLEEAPTGNTVRAIVKTMLAEADNLTALEASLNTLLQRRLPKKCCARLCQGRLT